MKFDVAWAKVAAQNVTLKGVCLLLAVFSVVQLVVVVRLSLKDPIVIERSCFSRVVEKRSPTATQEEISAFLGVVLPQRFSSDGPTPAGLISASETVAREKELAALKTRQIVQKVLVNDVKMDGKTIIVEADRLISIGKVKSVLPLKLRAQVEVTTRSEGNPYGLILSATNQVEEKDEK